jgi:hypothetical protein
MKKIFVAVGVLLLFFSACLWVTPYRTIVAISNALIDRDSQELSRHVDFPALKQGLKDQGNAFLLKEDPPDSQRNVFSSLGKMIGSKVIPKIIDFAITPEGMIAMMDEAAGLHDRREKLNSWWRRTSAPFIQARYGYDSLSTFSYWLPTEDGEIQFILCRSGLQWRLVNAVIPPDLLKRRFTRWVESN